MITAAIYARKSTDQSVVADEAKSSSDMISTRKGGRGLSTAMSRTNPGRMANSAPLIPSSTKMQESGTVQPLRAAYALGQHHQHARPSRTGWGAPHLLVVSDALWTAADNQLNGGRRRMVNSADPSQETRFARGRTRRDGDAARLLTRLHDALCAEAG